MRTVTPTKVARRTARAALRCVRAQEREDSHRPRLLGVAAQIERGEPVDLGYIMFQLRVHPKGSLAHRLLGGESMLRAANREARQR